MPFSVTDLKTTIADVLDPLKAAGEILVTQDAAMTRDIVDKVGRWTGFHFNVKLTGTPVDGEMSLNGEDLADAASITVTLATKDVFGTAMTEVVGDMPIGSKLVLRTNDGFQFGYVINSKSTDVSDRITFTLNPVSTNADFTPYTATEGHSIVASFLPLTGVDGSHRLIFGTHITFDNEDFSNVSYISFPDDATDSSGASVGTFYLGDRIVLRKLDGTSLAYRKGTNASDYFSFSGAEFETISSGFTLSAGDVLMMSVYRSPANWSVLYEDTQFTSIVPQTFAENTRSLLRNNSGSQYVAPDLFFYSASWWDSNHLDLTSEVFDKVVVCVETSFKVVPLTSDCSVLIEWMDNGVTLASKTVNNSGSLISINEAFSFTRNAIGTGIVECRLTFNKLCEVYGCKHILSFASLIAEEWSISAPPPPPVNNDFTFTWETTAINQVLALPLTPSGTYNFTVDWGDGSNATITTSTASHAYADPGVHTVTISGVIDGWQADLQPFTRANLRDIKNWGTLKFGSGYRAFWGCTGLVFTATDIPDTSACTTFEGFGFGLQVATTIPNMDQWDLDLVTSMKNAFQGAWVFNFDLSTLSLPLVNNTQSMLRDCFAFDHSLADFNMSSVTGLLADDMLRNCGMSILNYDATLIGWAAQTVQSGVTLGADGLQYTLGGAAETARDTLVNAPNNWNIEGDEGV